MNSAVHTDSAILLFRLVMGIFKVVGVAPFDFEVQRLKKTSNKTTTLKFSYSTIGLAYNIGLACSLIFSVHLLRSNYAQPDQITIHTLFMPFVYSSRISCNVIILILFVLQQNKMVRVANKLLSVDSSLSKKAFAKLYGERTFGCQYLLLISNFVIFIVLFTIQNFVSPFDPFYNANVLVGVMSNWAVIQYAFVLTYVQQAVGCLNRSLSLMSEASVRLEQFVVTSSVSHVVLCHLNTIRRIHLSLHEISLDLVKIYSWPSLLLITCSSCHLIYSVYVLFRPNEEFPQASWVTRLDGFVWMINFAWPIFILAQRVDDLKDEMIVTGNMVHRAMTVYLRQDDVKRDLHEFSNELLHRRIDFNACGFISLDRRLVQAIASTMVTYLIILMQYDNNEIPKNSC